MSHYTIAEAEQSVSMAETQRNNALADLAVAQSRITRMGNALKDARATLLWLQPDFGGPIAAQMGKAIQRINDALANDGNQPRGD